MKEMCRNETKITLNELTEICPILNLLYNFKPKTFYKMTDKHHIKPQKEN